MKKLKKSDPFTGIKFDALEMDNKSLIVHTPFHDTLTLEYDARTDKYTIPAKSFKYFETITLREAAEELGVSRMRISRMCKDNLLKCAKINGNLVIDYASVKQIKEKRE